MVGRKKVVVITESRSEYGIIRGLLEKLQKEYKVIIYVVGMHLLSDFGFTLEEVSKDGFGKIVRIDIPFKYKYSKEGMADFVGKAIVSFTENLNFDNPSLVIVTGDRGAMLSAAIAASHLSIPIAHISGGDVTQGGMIDDKVRNAISMFADVHFPTCQVSYDNLKKMLPTNSKIYLVGNPGIPMDYTLTKSQIEQIAKKYNLDIKKPIIIVLQHPVTSQDKESFEQMAATLDAILTLQHQTIVIYPNSDAGSDEMIICINAYRNIPYIQIHKSIPNEDFKALMKISKVIVGNSSCALLEAPSFGLWAVNIGTRQKGREQTTNVIHTTHDSNAIVTAIRVALSAKKKRYTNPYAQENSEDKIISILKEVI